MAIEKSTDLTNAVADPRVIGGTKGVEVVALDVAEIADGANGDSLVFKIAIPVQAVITSVVVGSDDLVGDATLSVGFHKQDNAPMGTTFTAVDIDALASNIDANDAAVAPTEVRFSVKGIETAKQPAFTLAGLSSKPSYGELYLSVTAETDTEATGTVFARVKYILP